MKRKLYNHWTAGTLFPNNTDLKHYHLLIDGNGTLHKGLYKIEDNDNCKDGKYAEHTGGLNTNAIGIALCGMCGFVSREKAGNFLLTKIQCEKLFETNAKIAIQENHDILTEDNLLTHYEVSQKVIKGEIKRTQLTALNIGKKDITYLYPYLNLKPDEIGDFIREKSNWYIKKLKGV